LLAESHVFTSDEDRNVTILPIAELPGYPTQYARFVYCLGYGEKALTNNRLHPKRDGTPQFWKILFSCRNRVSTASDFAPILGGTPPAQRLQNKITLLNELKEGGASIVALYKNGRKVRDMFRALEESWQSYTRNVVLAAQPEHVICIGRGVAGIVEDDLKTRFHSRYTVIHQPNAHLSSQDHMSNYMTYSKICCR
jgi:hypothetical protein